jgi:hypothetical protein
MTWYRDHKPPDPCRTAERATFLLHVRVQDIDVFAPMVARLADK